MVSIWILVAGGAVILSSLNVFPQIVKSYKTKKTNDLSWGMLLIIISGNILWTIYGLHIGDWAIITANMILFLTAAILSIMKFFYDKNRLKSEN